MSANYRLRTVLEFKPDHRVAIETLVDQMSSVCEAYIDESDSVFELPFRCEGNKCKLDVDIDLSLSGTLSGGVKRIEAVLSDMGKMALSASRVEVSYVSSGMERVATRYVGPDEQEIARLTSIEMASSAVAISRKPSPKKPRVVSGKRLGRPPKAGASGDDSGEWSTRLSGQMEDVGVDFGGEVEE